MKRILPALVVVLVSSFAFACDKNNSPTAPSPTAPPAASYVTVSGVIKQQDGKPATKLSVRATGPGRAVTTTTDGNGYYSLPGVQTGAITLHLSGDWYVSRDESLTISSDTRHDMRVEAIPAFSRSGTGANVFDMPHRTMRVRITGDYPAGGENFVVWIGGDLVVNEILGTRWQSTHYEGVHLVDGGVVEIKYSRDLRWSITEMR